MSTQIDPDILSTLTDEERAAIADDDGAEEAAALKAIVDKGVQDDPLTSGGDTDDAGGVDADADTDDAGGVDADADTDDAGGVDADDAGKAKATEVHDTNTQTFTPRYEASLPEGHSDKLKQLDAERKALTEKFKVGDIDLDAYTMEVDALTEKRIVLQNAVVKAEISQEMSAQAAEQQWNAAIRRQVVSAKNDGIDYDNDAEKGRDLDNFVKVLAANPVNGDKDFGWFLSEAHKRVKALHGITSERVTPIPDKPSRKPPIASIPVTLANVPGGDGPGDVSDEFSSIDSLSGIAYEEALAKMSPSQRERYLQAA